MKAVRIVFASILIGVFGLPCLFMWLMKVLVSTVHGVLFEFVEIVFNWMDSSE